MYKTAGASGMVGYSRGFATTVPLMRKEVEDSLKTNWLYVKLNVLSNFHAMHGAVRTKVKSA